MSSSSDPEPAPERRAAIEPWAKISSAPAGDFKIFTIRSERRRSPRTQQAHDFYVIDCAHWVNVVALTPDRQAVMIEQFRHGSNTVELEIPGGMMDPGDASPVAAGVRELREETGYTGENDRVLGQVFPNPAIMSNTCYTILVENCVRTHPVEFDHGEDLVTRLVPIDQIPGLVAAGKIQHSLVVVALYYLDLDQRSFFGSARTP
ncbi:NUDIX hydrolase [bacterium]|nr:NUDIX hydrolase [bacterium]